MNGIIIFLNHKLEIKFYLLGAVYMKIYKLSLGNFQKLSQKLEKVFVYTNGFYSIIKM